MRIKPRFSDEEFSQREDRICDLSFEDLVSREYSLSKDTKDIERITIRQYPKPAAAAVFYLHRKHQHLSTLGNVQCPATMLGASIIQSNSLVKDIYHYRKMGVESGEVSDILIHFSNHHFEWGATFRGLYIPKATIATMKWVSGAVTDLSAILGLTRPTVALITLVTGLSRSECWLTKGLRDPLLKEVERFNRWLEKLKSEIETEMD